VTYKIPIILASAKGRLVNQLLANFIYCGKTALRVSIKLSFLHKNPFKMGKKEGTKETNMTNPQ